MMLTLYVLESYTDASPAHFRSDMRPEMPCAAKRHATVRTQQLDEGFYSLLLRQHCSLRGSYYQHDRQAQKYTVQKVDAPF